MTYNTYHYSVYRFVPDIVRDEAMNLGVVVIDDDAAVARSAFLPDVRRKIAALAPDLNARITAKVVERFQRLVSGDFQASMEYPEDGRITSSERLRVLAAAMRNQFQLTEPRPYRARSLSDAVRQLYENFVKPRRATERDIDQQDASMPLKQLRALIWNSIRDWGEPVKDWVTEPVGDDAGAQVQIVQSRFGLAHDAAHRADYWVRLGEPLAAFVALSDPPDEGGLAWARRDAIPTIVADFRKINPRFTAVAVLPPDGRGVTSFERETRALLGTTEGVLIVHADELPELRPRIIPALV